MFTAGAINEFEQVAGPASSEIFAPHNMYGYLTAGTKWGDPPPADWDPRVIPPSIFDLDRVFCLVGTDPADYRLSRVVVGPQSDGLVRITDAQVPGAHRAYVYRSHSGMYGIVNSEEGYQNLRRFLFGRYQVAVQLGGLSLVTSGVDAGADASWQADLRLSVRGLPVVMDEQLAAHYCPVSLSGAGPVSLTCAFLLDPQGGALGTDAAVPDRSRFALQLRVFRVLQRSGFFDFTHHLEQIADFDDTLIADIGYLDAATVGGEPQVWAGWNSAVSGVLTACDPIASSPLSVVDGRCEIPLPETARAILGGSCVLSFTVSERQEPKP